MFLADENNLKNINEINADIIVIDAPCSGTGRIRRDPHTKWNISPESIKSRAKENFAILSKYAQAVKPGGSIYYMTCSLENEENNDIIEKFLTKNTDFEYAPLKKISGINLKENSSFFTLMPNTLNTDGFFIARIIKR